MNAASGTSSSQLTGSSLRDVVLEAAMKILNRDGLHLAPDSISYARVFGHIEKTSGIKVTRGSVHERIWASHDDFRRDVLAELVSKAVPVDYFIVDKTRESELREIVRTIDDLKMARLTVIKLVCEWSLDAIVQSETYSQVQSAKAVATRFNDPDAAAAMQQLLEDGSRRRLISRRELFGLLIRVLGMRLKPTLGLTMDEASDLFFSVSWALMSGAFLNAGAGCSHVFGEVDGNFGGPDDGTPWRVLSLGAKGLFEFLFEEDPAEPPLAVSDDRPAEVSTPLPEADQEPSPAAESMVAEKSRRRTRGELKQLVLQGGVETLQNTGMNIRPESLSYAAVFAQVYADHGLVVNRASVHKRFWSSHTEFCMEVMGLALQVEQESDPMLTADIYAVQPVIAADGLLNITQTAFDTLQAISTASLRPKMESPEMRRRMLIKSAIPDQPDSAAKTALQDSVVEIELAAVGKQMQLLQETVIDLGFEVRPELGLDNTAALQVMAILLHIVSVGVSFEQLAGVTGDGLLFKLLRVDGSDGFDEWGPVALLARAAFEMLYQPIAT